ncbi:hypothetical protein O181_014271 [Austropuccinia psidii MF-1]|uniref:Uncharacterized protein n=1 Tax=Austropuccinia psidii MF-1 TaxID=1389203 RepID=A0A9Q3BXU3_9BASI|nr:hypothetical protein [Austropuccinia psidii MF-1]
MSMNFVFSALLLATYLAPTTHGGYVPTTQNSVKFSQSFNTQTSSSSTSNFTTQLYSSVYNQPFVVIKSFPIGQSGITCEERRAAPGQGAGMSPTPASSTSSYGAASTGTARSVADLSPYDCRVQCTPSLGKLPNLVNCQKLITSIQGYKSPIQIEPETWLYMAYEDCAAIFENPHQKNPVVMYDWDQLATQVSRIQRQCLTSSSSGYGLGNQVLTSGACLFSNCADKNVNNLFSYDNGYNSNKNKVLSSLQDSGIMITIQFNEQEGPSQVTYSPKSSSYVKRSYNGNYPANRPNPKTSGYHVTKPGASGYQTVKFSSSKSSYQTTQSSSRASGYKGSHFRTSTSVHKIQGGSPAYPKKYKSGYKRYSH